ncbi:cytochrome P450 [Parvibaculum sp. MBR-TMA-1.3b-4.2]|jgi:cytochrome P450
MSHTDEPDSARQNAGHSEGSIREIADLPLVETCGSFSGRDSFRDTCRKLFALSDVPFLRTPDGQIVVFRNEHLRTLSTLPAAGNMSPDALSAGSFEALRDEAAAPAGTGGALVRILANQVFFTNAPLHDPARRILTKQLSPKAVAALEPLAETIIAELLAEITDVGEVDFQRHFGDELTCRFWAALIGMTAEEKGALVEFVRDMSGMFNIDPTEHDVHVFDMAADGYGKTVVQAVRRAVASGGFPLVDAIAEDIKGLEFSDDPAIAGIVPRDAGDYLAANLIDAFHTAALGASNVVYTMLRHPGVLDRLRADRSLLPAATFEGFRLEPPVLHLHRYALEEIVFEGVRIPKGTTIMMCWGAGNLDPKAFPEPEQFRLDRPMRGHSTFGAGAQICPGRILAFMLAEKTLDALVSQDLSVGFKETDCDWYEKWAMAQLKQMPIEIQRMHQ